MLYVKDASIGKTTLPTSHSSEFYSDPHRSGSATSEETTEAYTEETEKNEPPKYDFPVLMEAVQIKDPEDVTDAYMVAKYLPCYEMWELFIKLYSLAIGFSL